MKQKKLAVIMLPVLCAVLFIFAGCFGSSGSDGGTNKGDGQMSDGTNDDKKEETLAEFESGEGTESDPYIIAKPYQWQNISKHLDAHYELKSDLNMGEIEKLAPIGNTLDPFTGMLDGKGYKVHSAEISTSEACGLFGVISGGTVKNLNFSDSRLLDGSSSNTGSLVGQIRMGTLVENCHTTDISINYNGSNVGGLVGVVSSVSTLRYCSAKVSLVGKYAYAILGGLIGALEGGTVDACWTVGSAKVNCSGYLDDRVGGVVGSIVGGKITNVYTEIAFNSFHGAIAYSSSGGYGAEFGLCFNGASADSKKLYYLTDIDVEDTTSRYYDSSSMEHANDLLDENVDWANNPLWKKGRLHPELISYEEYIGLKK